MKYAIMFLMMAVLAAGLLVGCGDTDTEKNADTGTEAADNGNGENGGGDVDDNDQGTDAEPDNGGDNNGDTPAPGDTGGNAGGGIEPDFGAEQPLSTIAPTLGPIMQDYADAMKNKDWDACWGMLSQHDQAQWGNMLKGVKASSNIPTENLPENIKKEIEERKAALADINTGKEYFVYVMNGAGQTDPVMQDRMEAIQEGYRIVGEQIDGDEGWLKIFNKQTGEERKGMHFVKEGGAWKVDMMGGVPEMPDMPEMPARP